MSTAMIEDTVNTDMLGQRVLLLSPTMSIWRGQLQLPAKAEVHMDNRVLDSEVVTTPRVKLMTKSYPKDRNGKAWKSRFESCTSRLAALKNQFSVGFAINGVRIVPKTAASEFMRQLFGPTIGSLTQRVQECRDSGRDHEAEALEDELFDARSRWRNHPTSNRTPVRDPAAEVQSIAYEFWENVLDFVDDYDGVMRQIREHSDCWESVSKKVPKSKEAMFRKFDLGVFPIELSGAATSSDVVMADLENYSDVVRETCQQQVQLAIESMIAEPRRELAETIQNIETLIADSGRITSRTFDRVQRAMEKLQNFSFVTNDVLMERMVRLSTMLNTTIPASLRTDNPATASGTAAFAKSLADIRQDLVDPGIMESDLTSFGCRRRAIMFDDDE